MFDSISSSTASISRNMSVEASLRLLRDAGFDGVDFPLSVYSAEAGSPLRADDWRQWVRRTEAICRSLSLPVVQAHASWHQNIPADFRYIPPEEIYARTFEACRMLGCNHLIFHPLRQPERVDTPALRSRIHDYNVRWFYDLLPLAERFDVTIDLENTFDSHHVQRDGDAPYPYTTAEDMLALMRDIGSRRVAICLDTGHANISGQDVPAMIRAFGSDLGAVHLNDNYGRIGPIYEDLHLFVGYGKLDWAGVFAALREVRFGGSLNLEPISELKRMPDRVRLIQLRAAADTLRALAEI